MPTVLVLDSSLSMARLVPPGDSDEDIQQVQRRHDLAVHGINTFLDYLTTHYKLEFVALTTISSQFEVAVTFTRDYENIKTQLHKVEDYGKTCIELALEGIRSLVLEEWGSSTLCQVVIITDGRVGIVSDQLRAYMQHPPSGLRTSRDNKMAAGVAGIAEAEHSALPFPFNSRLHVMCVEEAAQVAGGLAFYKNLIDANGGDGQVFVPEGGPGTLSARSVSRMFRSLCDTFYVPFHGVLRCGSLQSHVQLCPAPEPYVRVRDFEQVKCKVAATLDICGFLEMNDVTSPAALSRHLVLPVLAPTPKVLVGIEGEDANKSESDTVEDEANLGEDGKAPSFCVLLHGSLKVEGMVAFCQLGDDWYGMLYSWADSKKKSNLMLTVFEPGIDVIPWLGKLNRLTLAEPKTAGAGRSDESSFPVKPSEKRSYALSSVVWIRQSGLQADIQKILRHARKLPEKAQNFYKELNRLRRAALSFGFTDLLDGMASILERECTLLPGTAHPDAALQLTNAANALRSTHCKDFGMNIVPLRTKFSLDELS